MAKKYQYVVKYFENENDKRGKYVTSTCRLVNLLQKAYKCKTLREAEQLKYTVEQAFSSNYDCIVGIYPI